MAESAQARYDFFVSYAEPDHEWVEGYLLPILNTAGARVLSQQEFRLGVPRLLELERAVKQSARVLLVLSPAYLAEEEDRFVALLGQALGLETATWPVIPLIYKDCKLPPRLAVLTALNAVDEKAWPDVVARLCAEFGRRVPEAAPPPECPYVGMEPFREADAHRFFGRGDEVEVMLAVLRKHRFLAVTGPSGSGKSSVVFAGLIPALRKSRLFGPGEWTVRTMRPDGEPMAALRSAVGDLLDISAAFPPSLPSSATPFLLVVDQFEELFVAGSEGLVEPFCSALLRLAGLPACHVVLTVRDDFYPDLMKSPLEHKVDAHHRYYMEPLGEEELRQVVLRPAEGAGVYVDAALVEKLVDDAGSEPGILPFLQETLVLLWPKVEVRYLSLSAYRALVLPRTAYGGRPLSGLEVAMADHADAVLDELSPAEKVLARRILLRLVQYIEPRAFTRRQQPVEALYAAGDKPGAVDRTLEHLAGGRLLTLSGEQRSKDALSGEQRSNDTLTGEQRSKVTLSGEQRSKVRRVDIAHEALIRGWPVLEGWVHDWREEELKRRRHEDRAAEWVRLRERKGGLLDKAQLHETEAWIDSEAAATLGCSDNLIALAAASRARLRTRRRLGIIGAASAALVALALVAFFVWLGYREWLRQSNRTDLIPIDGGPAIIGPDDRSVTLLPFRIEKYEVSVAQYRACVNTCACDPPGVPDWANGDEKWYRDERWDNLPIVEVSPLQAYDYCTWRGLRLPTAVEWERAARGPKGRLWPWEGGSKPATFCDSDPPVVEVNSHEETATVAPEAGIYHLADNVTEWTARIYEPCEGVSCHQPWDPDSDSPDGRPIALIGGSCDRQHINYVADVYFYDPENIYRTRGFRCAADGAP